MVDFLDIRLLNLLPALPSDIRPFIVFPAPIPVFLGDREIGTAVYESNLGTPFLRVTFPEPVDYRELAHRCPACETEQVPRPVRESVGQTWFAITKIVYASVSDE